MSYGKNENDEKVLSWFKLIVSLTAFWILQAYPSQLLHFKYFISGKSHEAFRPENALLINHSYREGSSLALFIFSIIYCLLCMLYSALSYYRYSISQTASLQLPLSLGFVLPNLSLSHPLLPLLPVLWELLSCDLLQSDLISLLYLQTYTFLPLTAHSCPSAASPNPIARMEPSWHTLLMGPSERLNMGTAPARNWKLVSKLDQCFDVKY